MKSVFRKHTKGFTLIELLVVISIITLLSSVVLSSLKTVRAKGRDARRYQDVHNMNNALQLYVLNNNGRAPDIGRPGCDIPGNNIGGCHVADWDPDWAVLANQLKPYMKSLPKDPCGVNCPGAYLGAGEAFYAYEYEAPGDFSTDPSEQLCILFRCPTGSDYMIGAGKLETKNFSGQYDGGILMGYGSI